MFFSLDSQDLNRAFSAGDPCFSAGPSTGDSGRSSGESVFSLSTL